MRFWSDDVEDLRPEARRCVADLAPRSRERFGGGAPNGGGLDRFEHARLVRALFPAFAPDPAGGDVTIEGVRCRVFASPARPPRGVYLHFHGGGMVLGTPELNDASNAHLARSLGITVVSVDYSLAPEHPHPAACDEAEAVASWLLAHAERELGSSRLIIAGESAGAYLAVMTLLRVRDRGAPDAFAGACLAYGVYDWGGSRRDRSGALLDTGDPSFFASCYLPGLTEAERRDAAISPLHARLDRLAPAFMGVGTEDHLLEDTLGLAARWAAAGNPLELFVAPDLPHAFEMYRCGITFAYEAAKLAWCDERLANGSAR